MTNSLSPHDLRQLKSLDHKIQLVRDRVAGVATHRHTGFLMSGRGGIGKSRTIFTELEQREVSYKLSNSHMTPRALFDQLEAFPEALHVIEDIEALVRDRNAVGVLRSALWGTRRGRDGRVERLVTWSARGACSEFVFTGGLILTSNRSIGDLPELSALKTRVTYLHLDVSDDEILALMRRVALAVPPEGDTRLSQDERLEVVEFIVGESLRINRRLDMRLLVNSFEDRLQVEDLEAGCSWQDLVASRIHDRASIADDVVSVGVRASKRAERLKICREIVGLERLERLRVWREKTGASEATLYRILQQLAEVDAC